MESVRFSRDHWSTGCKLLPQRVNSCCLLASCFNRCQFHRYFDSVELLGCTILIEQVNKLVANDHSPYRLLRATLRHFLTWHVCTCHKLRKRLALWRFLNRSSRRGGLLLRRMRNEAIDVFMTGWWACTNTDAIDIKSKAIAAWMNVPRSIMHVQRSASRWLSSGRVYIFLSSPRLLRSL